MQRLRYGPLWLATGIVILGIVLTLALIRMPALLPFAGGDKVQHLGAFAFLTVWFAGVFERHHAVRIAIALLAYGILIELLQSLTTYRAAEVLDVVADACGVALGMGLAAAGLRTWCARVEAVLGVAS